ncbi:cell division protein FtsJ [Paenibacillus flagellatus]|uniref:Cell division protein FtsJ n=1 Tax=Paenibacillus flagellatus TaxID=2211139 RepID=A0A2V5KCT6_9BACL|nr:cell division protein FtsJ [Paenibacillus flagellatus]
MIDLFLDDARPCPKRFTLARDAAECIELLKTCDVRVLSLDYDLGWNEPTGLEVARYIATEGNYPAVIYLHTSSPSGRQQMFQMLYANKPARTRLVNGPMPDDVKRRIAEGNFVVENGTGDALQ